MARIDKKKSKEEDEEDEEDDEESEEEDDEPEEKKIKKELNKQGANNPQAVFFPRAISIEDMFNVIFDRLNVIEKKLDNSIGQTQS